jgi:DNA-binding IscR family transcriptional regulator
MLHEDYDTRPLRAAGCPGSGEVGKWGGACSDQYVVGAGRYFTGVFRANFLQTAEGRRSGVGPGPGGGFCFARPLNKVTIRDVLYAAGEDLDLIACEKQAPECERLGQCLSHAVWTDVTILINKYFNSITLAQVIKNNRICDKAGLEMEEILNGTTGS